MGWEEQFKELPTDIQGYIGRLQDVKKKRVPTLLRELNEIVKTHPDVKREKDKERQYYIAWAILYNRYIPQIKTQDIQTEDEQGSLIKKIMVDDKTEVWHTTEGISEEIKGKDGKYFTRHVYRGSIKPIERLLVDGVPFFRYKSHVEQVDTMRNITRKLKKEGGVLNKNRLDDCINAIFLDLPQREGHASYGIYENKDGLELCLDAMPVRESQQQVLLRCEPSVKQPLTRETLEAYFKTLGFWHPYEILPNMGLSAVSPFALMLRKRGKLVPILYNYAPSSHLGKSTVHKIFSQYLFSVLPFSGGDLDSRFRVGLLFDSICCFVVADEVDNVNFNRISDLLKKSPENYICSIRGTPEQGMNEYLSRAVLAVNGNRFRINDKPVMVRVFKIEFDMNAIKGRADEKATNELMEVLSKLRPIGWRLAELELDAVEYSLDKMLERINTYEQELRKLYHRWVDPRRATAWAITYLGLKIWELASIKHGLDWRAPSYDEFVEQVVAKVESSTRETGETPIADFLHWWEMWKVRNVRRKSESNGDGNYETWDEIIGINKIWTAKRFEFGGEEYAGDVITNAVLREYKKDKESKIDSLADIAKTVAMKTGISKDVLLKSWDFGGTTKWGVFIPSDIWDKELDEELKKTENNDIT